MIPIRDNLRPQTFPIATWSLITLNAVVFLWQIGMPEWMLDRFVMLYGIVPARLTEPIWAWRQGFPGGAWLTLFTSMFIHGGWFHFLANIWTLKLFGSSVEERLGAGKFLGLYLLTGVIAGYSHVALFPDSLIPTIGASGAISGIMGAYFFLFPRAQLELMVPVFFFQALMQVPAAMYLPFWFFSQLFSGTLSLVSSAFDGVAFWAHIGGFVAGLALIPLFCSESRSTVQAEPIGEANRTAFRGTWRSRPRTVYPEEIIHGAKVYILRRS